eukprot:CAMPEP_0173344904 /NCGR_PEP_ID=MMETSP1144-20121109/11668_1 /TAXON_ID=483371 /ORGANISM="non described non described, Strain CCMP2298" /LENGTH=154 /DNA_ID=CAMNT_0014291953 /DNA_START=54 /DNA_END=515 /DNA_ORIENTATION=-
MGADASNALDSWSSHGTSSSTHGGISGDHLGFQLSEEALQEIQDAQMREIHRQGQLVRDRARGASGDQETTSRGGPVPKSAPMFGMRVLLRGERGSGKSLLWRRFQGQPFSPTYTPTPQIQSASITWTSHASACDRVRVEVWDVVDSGIGTGIR